MPGQDPYDWKPGSVRESGKDGDSKLVSVGEESVFLALCS